jgi:hypothetical protein
VFSCSLCLSHGHLLSRRARRLIIPQVAEELLPAVLARALFVFISSGRSPSIRIIGAPRNQPNPGRNVECSPLEQSIVGDIIGPTDLCDRLACVSPAKEAGGAD